MDFDTWLKAAGLTTLFQYDTRGRWSCRLVDKKMEYSFAFLIHEEDGKEKEEREPRGSGRTKKEAVSALIGQIVGKTLKINYFTTKTPQPRTPGIKEVRWYTLRDIEVPENLLMRAA